MEKNLKFVSANYIGSIGNNYVFDAVVELYGNEETINIIEQCFEKPKPHINWKVVTDKGINIKERTEILNIFMNDKPIYIRDGKPKIYNKEINIEEEVKSMDGWHQSDFDYLNDYLNIGDKVDQSIVNYMIDVLPPVTMTGMLVQMGEPYSCDKFGRATYLTVGKDYPFGDWYYKGICIKGKSINEEKRLEIMAVEEVSEKEYENIEEESEEEEM